MRGEKGGRDERRRLRRCEPTAGRRIREVKTALRRLQQLEQRHSESLAANDGSGALERILEKINAMADPRRGNPNWEATPRPTVAEVTARLREAVSRSRGEVAR
jgi:hypothetical protein